MREPLTQFVRLLLAVILVPWLVPSSASGQSTAYVVTTAPAECGVPDHVDQPCSRGFISIVNTDTRQSRGRSSSGRAGPGFVSDLTVSADGRRLYVAITSVLAAPLLDCRRGLGLRYLDPSADHGDQLGGGYDARCAWAPDARHLFCSQNGRPDSGVWVIDTETNAVTNLPSG